MAKLPHKREEYVSSLWLFVSEILQFPDVTEESHKDFCDDIQERCKVEKTTKDLYLMPRGYFKTTIGVIALPIWILFRNPNETIFLASSNLGVARERLLSI